MKEITVSSRKLEISSILKNKGKVKFQELFEHFTKPYIVATFLAILEMARENSLLIKQEKTFGEIIVEGTK